MSKSFSCAIVLSLFVCVPVSAHPDSTCVKNKDPSLKECMAECNVHMQFGGGSRQAKAQTLGTDPSLYLHTELLFDGVRAWTNLPSGSEFRDPPAFMKFLPTTLASWYLFPGTGVTYTCPNAPDDIEVCDAWIFYYTCSECNDNYDGIAGGLVALLTIDPDWEAVNCAPSFTNGFSDAVHPMRAFRRQLQPGESAEVTLPGVAEFLAFGIDGHAINCGLPDYDTVYTCPTDTGRCKWEGGVCKNQNCARHGQGPSKGCPSPCPWSGPRDALGM